MISNNHYEPKNKYIDQIRTTSQRFTMRTDIDNFQDQLSEWNLFTSDQVHFNRSGWDSDNQKNWTEAKFIK